MRNVGIDLLKIICMIMVLTIHVLGHGGILEASTSYGTLSVTSSYCLEILVYCAVNCYALITGFVSIKDHHRLSGIAALWLRVVYYGVFIAVIMQLFFPSQVDLHDLTDALTPITSKAYWYFTAYVCVAFFSPILNVAIDGLRKNQLRCVIVSGLLLFVAVNTVNANSVFGLQLGYSAVWIGYLYVIGGYIRKYGCLERLRPSYLILMYVLSAAVTAILKFSGFDALFSYTSPTMMFCGVCLLLVFQRMNISGKLRDAVERIEPLSFSAYLIQDNALTLDLVLNGALVWVASLNFLLIPLVTLGIAILIFVVCCLLDSIRSLLFSALRVKERLRSVEIRIEKRWGLC